MAEGLLRGLYGDRFDVWSAGTAPSGVHPLAVRALAEAGYDISGQISKNLGLFEEEFFDDVITLCDTAAESCPYFPHADLIIHRGFDDPSAASGSEEERLSAFRRVRDEIRAWIVETFGSLRPFPG
jgi:arsenate reductase (thioredoxin)